MGKRPQPLDAAEQQDFKDSGHDDLMVRIGDEVYNREDLWTCLTCNKPQLVDTDEHGDCRKCSTDRTDHT